MNKQQTRGKVKKFKGRAKEVVGIVTGNKKLERAGSRQKTEGAIQESLGNARQKTGQFVAGVAKKIKK